MKVNVIAKGPFGIVSNPLPPPFHSKKAVMDGCRVVRVEEVCAKVDLVVTATGNKKVVSREHMEKMKNGTILVNMGHANTEIDVLSLKSPNITWEKVRNHTSPKNCCVR